MKTINVPINKGEWLLDGLKRIGYDMIPTNSILDKTLTGLGATHSEIHSKRNSIIIEPNIPVILGKLNENENLEAVYEKCEPYTIKKYLQMNIQFKKILTTPESFHKIRDAASTLGIDIYKDYFCLFDECEKVTQDIDYRRKIAQPIHDFFLFNRKALVSATPLPISHPELEKQEFQKIKIVPSYDYKKNLHLIVTNSYYKRLKIVLDGLKNSKHICIFFNVTDGINELINSLKITDYKVFCSQKSVDKLKDRGIDKAYSLINYPLAKYNFFTCRFYSALDILLRKDKPDILIITDLRGAQFTMIDPLTEAIQIQGRFRKRGNDDVTYNSLTHITTINPDLKVWSTMELDSRISRFRANYEFLKQEYEVQVEDIEKQAIDEDMRGLKWQELIDGEGNINPFAIDNLYNEERIKSYYQSANNLYNAYLNTNFFNITFDDFTECVGEDDFEKLNHTKLEIDKRKLIVKFLENIHNDYKQKKITDENKEFYIDYLERQPEARYTIDAYNKIGKIGIEQAQYKKSLINKAIKEHNKEQAEKLRFSNEVLQDIKKEFEINTYISKNDIKKRLQLIFSEHSIEYKVVQDTIKEYYQLSESNSKNAPSFKLKAFKFE